MERDPQFSRLVSRRQVLHTTGGVATALVLAACGGPAASPTPKAAEATKPAAGATKPAAEATKPGAAAATKPAEATKPAAAGATATGAGAVKDVPRNRRLVVVFGGREGKWADFELWNPYAVNATHQYGANLLYEPLAYYSAYADKWHLWLAESYKYSPDFKELTIKTRSGITWSDGKPFSAEDVAFTLTTLKDKGAEVKWGPDVQPFVESATATDANTVSVKFKQPAPRFFYFMTYKFDIGVYIVPKHIFEGQDWTKFTHFDIAKGQPVTTGPWQVVHGTPEQKLIDRRADWWAVKAGLSQLPKVERLVYLPMVGETQLAQAMIANEVDTGLLIVPTFKTLLAQNPKITTHSGRDKPYGYVDWWPLSLWVNNEKEPFKDPNARWGISHLLDRKQIVDVAYEGASSPSRLPMPTYPPLMPYFDAVKGLLEKYDTTKFDPAKGAELLQQAGWKKDGNVWKDASGTPVKMEILGFSFMSVLGPVVAEQLKRQGIDAVFSMPPDAGQRFTRGEYVACIFGHGGSVAGDPYDTLRQYQSAGRFTAGQSNWARWKNEEFDKLVDEIYATSMEDQTKLISLFQQAMELWLPELPDIQLVEFYHNIARNETYWTGWPSKDNPYVNEASWHLTWQLVLNRLEPAQ